MQWQTVVGEVISLPEIQPPYRPPVRVVVPMEELEARANRFVLLVAGHTANAKPLKPSKLRLPWQVRVVKEEAQRLRQFPVDDQTACSDPPNSRT